MDIPAILELGIGLANTITESAQSTVLHYQWKRAGVTFGEHVYDTPVSRPALVDYTAKRFFLPDGTEIIQKSTISFLEPIAAHGATGRTEPIDMRDKFVLPNGYTGPIVKVNGGLLNPNTDAPFAFDVILG